MTDKDFLERYLYEVCKMRDMQKAYFSSRSDTNLKYAKSQESVVDEMHARLIRRGYKKQSAPPQSKQQDLI